YRLLIPGLATGYSPKGKGFALRPLLHGPPGASNVHSTVRDLALWDQNFYEARIGGRELLDAMQERAKLNDGKPIAYGGGLMIDTYRGLKTVAHTGSHGGYKTVILRFPEQRFSVILLANERTFNPMRMAEKVADIFLRDQLKPLPPLPDEINVETKVLDELTGVYKVGPALLDVRRDGEKLIAVTPDERKTLVPFARTDAATEFVERADGVRYRFTQSKTGQSLTVAPPGRKSTAGTRLEVADKPPANLKDYAGIYWSKELETFGSIVLRDGKLILQLPKTETPLSPLANGEFLARPAFTSWVTLKFSVNEAGHVEGYALSTERVRNLRYGRARIEIESGARGGR